MSLTGLYKIISCSNKLADIAGKHHVRFFLFLDAFRGLQTWALNLFPLVTLRFHFTLNVSRWEGEYKKRLNSLEIYEGKTSDYGRKIDDYSTEHC